MVGRGQDKKYIVWINPGKAQAEVKTVAGPAHSFGVGMSDPSRPFVVLGNFKTMEAARNVARFWNSGGIEQQ